MESISLGKLTWDDGDVDSSIDDLTKSIGRLEDNLDGVDKSGKKTARSIDSVGKEAKDASKDVNKLGAGLKDVGDNIKGDITGRLGTFGKVLGGLGPAGLAAAAGLVALSAAAAGLGIFGKHALDVTAKNQALITSFESLGVSSPVKLFDELNDTILDLNLDSVSAYETASKLFSSGFSEKGIITVTKALGDLEARLGGSLGKTASGAVREALIQVNTLGRAGKEQVEAVAKAAGISTNQIFENISKVTGQTVAEVKAQSDKLLLDPKMFTESVVKAIQGAEGPGTDALKKANSTWKEAMAGASDLFNDLFDFSRIDGASEVSPLTSAFVSIQEAIKEVRPEVNALKEDILESFQEMFPEANNMTDVIKILTKDGIIALFTAVKDLTSGISSLMKVIGPTNDLLDDTATKTEETIGPITRVVDLFSSLLSLTTSLNKILPDFLNPFSLMPGEFDSVAEAGISLSDALGGINIVIDTMTNGLTSLLDAIDALKRADFAGVKRSLSGVLSAGSDAVSENSKKIQARSNIGSAALEAQSLLRTPTSQDIANAESRQEAQGTVLDDIAKKGLKSSSGGGGKKATETEAEKQRKADEKKLVEYRKQYDLALQQLGEDRATMLLGNKEFFAQVSLAKTNQVTLPKEAQEFKALQEKYQANVARMGIAWTEQKLGTFDEYVKKLADDKTLSELDPIAKAQLDQDKLRNSLSSLEQSMLSILEGAGGVGDLVADYVKEFDKIDLDATFAELTSSQTDRVKSLIAAKSSVDEINKSIDASKTENQKILALLNQPQMLSAIKAGKEIKITRKEKITEQDLLQPGALEERDGILYFKKPDQKPRGDTSSIVNTSGTPVNNSGSPKTSRSSAPITVAPAITITGGNNMDMNTIRNAVKMGIKQALSDDAFLAKYLG